MVQAVASVNSYTENKTESKKTLCFVQFIRWRNRGRSLLSSLRLHLAFFRTLQSDISNLALWFDQRSFESIDQHSMAMRSFFNLVNMYMHETCKSLLNVYTQYGGQ